MALALAEERAADLTSRLADQESISCSLQLRLKVLWIYHCFGKWLVVKLAAVKGELLKRHTLQLLLTLGYFRRTRTMPK